MNEGIQMIYFDNASTSRVKPDVVYDAFNFYARNIGTSPGRGSYSLAIEASRMLYRARKEVAAFFGVEDPNNVVFTKNSTEAVNLFFNGYLKRGDHVLISPYEHNAVLRPLHLLKSKGIIDYTVLPEEAIYFPERHMRAFIKENTRLLAITLASNLTGQIVYNQSLSRVAKEERIKVFVDASQGAGKMLVDMRADQIDVLAFTGHKDLLAMPGVGGLVGLTELRIAPLIQGGTGIHGDSYVNPDAFPDSYEAGTLNMPAIWSLKTSLEYIRTHIQEHDKKESSLLERLLTKMKLLDHVILYNENYARVPTVCFNRKGMSSSDVVSYLDKNKICVRGGIHCAILAHETLGTVKTGAVRISLNAFNTEQEIDTFIKVMGAL